MQAAMSQVFKAFPVVQHQKVSGQGIDLRKAKRQGSPSQTRDARARERKREGGKERKSEREREGARERERERERGAEQNSF